MVVVSVLCMKLCTVIQDYMYHLSIFSLWSVGFPGGASGKEPAWQSRRHKRWRYHPWVRKTPWRRAQQPTPVFLPGKSHGQRSLAGYSLWGCKALDMTERLSPHAQVRALWRILVPIIQPGDVSCIQMSQGCFLNWGTSGRINFSFYLWLLKTDSV